MVAGDFDGDVDEDLVIALISASGIQATLWENNDGELESTTVSFAIPVLEAAPSSVHLILRAGNIDRDKRVELAAVVNEPTNTPTSRYFVFDDARSEFEELQSGSSTATLPTSSTTAATRSRSRS